ncbi:MAG: DUF4412 domain-containing protein [Chthoniobacteraceae bacterium]
MKSFLATTLAALVFTFTASADWVIESKIESPHMNTATTTKVKGDKVRSDIASGPMGAMSSIIDAATGDSVQLLHGQKMAMKTSAAQLKQAMEMAKGLSGAKAGTEPVKPQASGEKEKIGDYSCEIWTWTDGNSVSKFWIAAGHPQAAALKEVEKKMRGGALGGMQMGPDMSSLPGPALKTEMTAMGMKTTVTILSIKEQAVDAKEFDVPADYQSMAMPALPGAK